MNDAAIDAGVAARLESVEIFPTVTAAREKCPGRPIVATHDGNFHVDEALACALLRHTAAFRDAVVVRTRNPKEIDAADAVVDVGGVYDEMKQRFDHHQPEFQGTMTTPAAVAGKDAKKYKTRLSSAGLVYKHFGLEVLARIMAGEVAGVPAATGAHVATEAQRTAAQHVAYDRVYKGFVEHIDGIDNGVEEFSPVEAADGAAAGGIKRNYRVTSSLSGRVAMLYPPWNATASGFAVDARQFKVAMALAMGEFLRHADATLNAWLPARGIVEAAFDAAASVHASGRIVRLDVCPPWKEHLNDVESDRGAKGKILYVLFPDGKGAWRVQCVTKENTAFTNRKSLLWKGLRDDALSAASGIPGGVFVHAGGFIGGNATFDGALAMAVKSMEAPEEEAKRPRDEATA